MEQSSIRKEEPPFAHIPPLAEEVAGPQKATTNTSSSNGESPGIRGLASGLLADKYALMAQPKNDRTLMNCF